MTGSVELFVSPHCRCSEAGRRRIRDFVRAAAPHAAWSEINVLDEMERAVASGVRATPAIAVDGRVVTSGRLDLDALRAALETSDGSQHR